MRDRKIGAIPKNNILMTLWIGQIKIKFLVLFGRERKHATPEGCRVFLSFASLFGNRQRFHGGGAFGKQCCADVGLHPTMLHFVQIYAIIHTKAVII